MESLNKAIETLATLSLKIGFYCHIGCLKLLITPFPRVYEANTSAGKMCSHRMLDGRRL